MKFKHGSEPDGFREIKWGTDIFTLKGMQEVETEEYLKIFAEKESFKSYTREGEILKIGSSELLCVVYSFWKGKFFSVMIYTVGYENWKGLRDACIEKFAKEYIDGENGGVWCSDIAFVQLAGDSSENPTGKLMMFSCQMSRQIKERAREKAKEGAEKDF